MRPNRGAVRAMSGLTIGYVSPVLALDRDERAVFLETQKRVRELAGDRKTRLEMRIAMWEGVAKEVWR